MSDEDNTLTSPYKQNVWPLIASLEECKEVFGRPTLLSNSAGGFSDRRNGKFSHEILSFGQRTTSISFPITKQKEENI